MKYLTEGQVQSYLKMGRDVAQFLGIGEYFESVTFNWVLLSGSVDNAKIELVRSIDEGDEYNYDVSSFSTAGDYEVDEIKQFYGSLSSCILWLESELGGNRATFFAKRLINSQYKLYVLGKTVDSEQE